MSDFGITFENARKAQGFTLDQIAAETRIGKRFLEAIEKEQFQILPGGIFSRGFVRTYAEHLKLDVDKTLSEFEQLTNLRAPPTEEEVPVPVPPLLERIDPKLYPVAIGVLIVLVFVVYIATRKSTPSVIEGQPPAISAARPAPLRPAPVETPPPVLLPKPARNALTVVIKTKATTWVKVRRDDSSVVAQETLKPGMTRRYTAQNSIGLSVGNAGVVSIKVNDRDIPPLGKNGQIKSITITAETIKSITGG